MHKVIQLDDVLMEMFIECWSSTHEPKSSVMQQATAYGTYGLGIMGKTSNATICHPQWIYT